MAKIAISDLHSSELEYQELTEMELKGVRGGRAAEDVVIIIIIIT